MSLEFVVWPATGALVTAETTDRVYHCKKDLKAVSVPALRFCASLHQQWLAYTWMWRCRTFRLMLSWCALQQDLTCKVSAAIALTRVVVGFPDSLGL